MQSGIELSKSSPSSNRINGQGPEFQVEGNIFYLTESRRRHSPEPEKIQWSKQFIVTRKGRQWKIRTTNLNEDAIQYEEMGCDGTKIFQLRQCNANKFPENTDDKNFITASGRVLNGNFPVGFDSNLIFPLWLAYCSSDYFLSRKDDRIVTPLFLVGDFLSQAVHQQCPCPPNGNLMTQISSAKSLGIPKAHIFMRKTAPVGLKNIRRHLMLVFFMPVLKPQIGPVFPKYLCQEVSY